MMDSHRPVFHTLSGIPSLLQAFSPLAATKVQVEISTAHLALIPAQNVAVSLAEQIVDAFKLACSSNDCPNIITFNAENSQSQAGGSRHGVR